MFIRFRCSSSKTWSSWVAIRVNTAVISTNNEAVKLGTPTIEGRDTILIRAESDGAVEWTMGLKRSYRPPLGLDFILFSEVWIANLTDLPLVFGAPRGQVIPSVSDACPGPSAAESALIEISSILEFGERGKGLEKEHEENMVGLDVYEFGHQLTDEVIGKCFFLESMITV